MKSIFKPLLLATLLATAGVAAVAASGYDCAGMMNHGGGKHYERMGKMDPAKMQARMDKRSDALKAQLKITAAQESAWTAYTAAMKPPAGMMAKRPDMTEMQKLSTPERIDKMQALHTQRMTEMNAAMSQRGDATKALYATLTAEQKKIFDENAMQSGGRHGGMHGMMGKGAGPAPAQPK
jgi:hypothetical protein